LWRNLTDSCHLQYDEFYNVNNLRRHSDGRLVITEGRVLSYSAVQKRHFGKELTRHLDSQTENEKVN
jgi:hypothetical protein